MNKSTIKSAVTVSLVDEARGGPFVFWDGLTDAFQQAAALGFDGIEIFAPGPDAVDSDQLKQLVDEYQLPVAAVGTGAGMVKHGLSLTDADESKRIKAKEFIRSMVDFGADWGAPAIIGSMQGRWGGPITREQALELLATALNDLGQHAQQRGVALLYEPLNRYETNLLTTIESSVQFVQSLDTSSVKLLADLFHMNIEEADLADAIRVGASHIGHIHFVDSNRQAAGFGHLDFEPLISALKEIEYEGYLSAEAFPLPDSAQAARQTIDAFTRFLP